MEGVIDLNSVLDFVVFQISSTTNRFEAHVCGRGKNEKLASGPLDQLAFHLPDARPCLSNQPSDSFKLQIDDSLQNLSWFTKSTVASFLHIINAPEVLKVACTIENEMSQLEDTKKFHLALYAKDNGGHPERGTADMCTPIQIKDDLVSSDATKNELLRAMDSRLLLLEEELYATFKRAVGSICSIKQISDLVAFAEHFGATNLRNSLSKLLSVVLKDQPADTVIEQPTVVSPRRIHEDETEEVCHPASQTDGVSPAKIAQAERQISSESEESSDSSDADHSFSERSRTLIRSGTPKRSASPMRRIQIGRSGPRRSTALTIKSLNYFPARDRMPSNRETEGNSSGDEEPDQVPKKPENTVRRMSVQDAISLFENKQKDQNLDVHKRRASEVSNSTNKSVLRRWSAGMGDSFTNCSQESASDTPSHNASKNLFPEAENKSVEKAEFDGVKESTNPVEIVQVAPPSGQEEMTSSPVDNPTGTDIYKAEEVNDRTTASAEWNQQKEAELNQMLTTMMESKPRKYRDSIHISDEQHSISGEQRGVFNSQYKGKKDEKLQEENAGKRAEKEAQIKLMRQTLEQSKKKMASKSGSVKGKQDLVDNSQKPRGTSSSPVSNRKEVSRANITRKASPKTSPLPATRSSWSSGPLSKSTGTPQTRTPPSTISTSSTTSRRKSQPTPPPTRPSPRIERSLQQPKGSKGTAADVKHSLGGQESKQQKIVRKSNRTAKAKEPPASEDDSAVSSAKPSFYNKVTKKNSVVPLESKPFLRKGSGIGPGVASGVAKSKIPRSDESSKNSGNLIHSEEKECSTTRAESPVKVLGTDLVQDTNGVDTNLDSLQGNDLNAGEINTEQSSAIAGDAYKNVVELPVPEIQPDMNIVISSAAWVEAESQEAPTSCENYQPEITVSPELVPGPSASPRAHHSLSQMLQADSYEPEIIEWGNAENPPALVYQKDAPKGFKRLLKFARKSKGEANVTGWAAFSEGEDDQEESKTASKRSSDTFLKKATRQTKGKGKQNPMLSESFDGSISSKWAINNQGMSQIFSAQSNISNVTASSSDMLQKGHISEAVSNKSTRSIFSLSTFRSSKSNEAKLR